MEDTKNELQRCMERLVWDFLEIHGFMSGRKAEVTLPAALTLFLVQHYRLQMKDLAGVFNVSSSTVTDYVDFLEKKGYVTRVRSEEDRREVYIELTPKGWDWIAENKRITWDYLDERMSRLTIDERKLFVSLMYKLIGIEEPIAGLQPATTKNE